MTSAAPKLILAHSSDLHIDDGYTMRAWNGDGNGPLAAVIETACTANTDILLLTGDVFEHNRLKNEVLDRTRSLLMGAPFPVVMLPGNHDPLTPQSVWERAKLDKLNNVHVIDRNQHTAIYSDYDLHIWGKAHIDYIDMSPLTGAPSRTAKYHVVSGHGHYVEVAPPKDKQSASWLITSDEIEAAGADYVALGHWNVSTQVGQPSSPAYYSGAPDYAETINIVEFWSDRVPKIKQHPVLGLPGK